MGDYLLGKSVVHMQIKFFLISLEELNLIWLHKMTKYRENNLFCGNAPPPVYRIDWQEELVRLRVWLCQRECRFYNVVN